MDPREEMHVLVTQKLWGIGAEAMDLLVILCRIADPSITDDAVVPALNEMFRELPQWLEGVSVEDLVRFADNPPAGAVHFRLLVSLRGLGLFLEQTSGMQLQVFTTLLPPGTLEHQVSFLLEVQQVVCSWNVERIVEMRNMLEPMPDHMRQQQVLCMNNSISYMALPLVTRILCLPDDELQGTLSWFPTLSPAMMNQFVLLLTNISFDALLEIRARLARTQPSFIPSEETEGHTGDAFTVGGGGISPVPTPPSPSVVGTPAPLFTQLDGDGCANQFSECETFGGGSSSMATGGGGMGSGGIGSGGMGPGGYMAMENSTGMGGAPLKLRIIEQPPSQTVYQRLLKPQPKVMLENAMADDMWVEAVLIRQDSDTPIEGKCMIGTKLHHIAQGKVAVFSKLKIMFTSQQQGTLFRLKFVLKRYVRDHYEEIPSATVVSNPMEVFSHSVYIRRPKHATPPVIGELLPCEVSAGTPSRLCIIGNNFNNSMTISVRIGSQTLSGGDVMFHGSGTLLVNAPPMAAGEYQLSASNDGAHFCEPVRFVVR